MKNKIIGWFSIGSTYTYLTALRLQDLMVKRGFEIEIKPISIRHIMKSMNNIPFPPEKKEKVNSVSYTHLRAHETPENLVRRRDV